MSESIRKQIKDGKAGVEHKHLQEQVELPTWLQGCAEVLDDPNALFQHLLDQGVALGILHGGLRDTLTQVRAKARAWKGDTPVMDHEAAGATIPHPLPDPAAKSGKQESPQEYIARRKAEGAPKKTIMEELGL